MTNPLLDLSGLPSFDAIRPEHVGPAIDQLLAEAEAAVKAAEQVSPVRWDSFVTPLDDATERLWRAWAQVGHLQAVVNTPELREAYNSNLPKVSRFGSALGQNLALYAQYKALAQSPEAAHFDEARRKVLENALRDFRLAVPSSMTPPRRGLRKSRKNSRHWRPSFCRTCSTPPMRGVTSPKTTRSYQGCRPK